MALVNSTFIVQIVHFGIAWGLMRLFLWPRLLAAYDAAQESERQLHADVQIAQEQLEISQDQIESEWATIAQQCRAAAQVPEHEERFVLPEMELPPMPNESALKKQVEQAAQEIVQRIEHA